MLNIAFLESYTPREDYEKSLCIKLSVESFITYWIYKYCCPKSITVQFVPVQESEESLTVDLANETLNFIDLSKVPWQAASCVFPVAMYEDTVITGLCAVARHIAKFRSDEQKPQEHEEGLLGFRKSCLQAPNEVSIWTKFCEVEIIKTVKDVLKSDCLKTIPVNLVRFENHLSKPVRVHNVFKLARNLKKEGYITDPKPSNHKNSDANGSPRISKSRKWKSNIRKQNEIDSSTRIEDLDISHQFAEGPFLTLADMLLLPSYYIIIKSINESIMTNLFPLTHKWFCNLLFILQNLDSNLLVKKLQNIKHLTIQDTSLPETNDVSLYKCDPKRHNPKKRLFTKEEDVENALGALGAKMELKMSRNELKAHHVDWSQVPDGANPQAGHLPESRIDRKMQQLENLALAALSVYKPGDIIVDFCSGSGHLGILIAHLLPQCTVILLENKEQSLQRAKVRVQEMKMKNVLFFHCNLDFFIGKFDIGVALHACGIASDLVLDKCLKANAKFIICPCCYGSLHSTDRLIYPRSKVFCSLSIDQYLCIGHAADQTHEEHRLTARGSKCMAVIDSDRGRLAEEYGYNVQLLRLDPLSCTPKNNLLIGMPG